MTEPAAQIMGARDWLLLGLLSLLWGGSFVFARVAVSEWPPLAVVFVRVSLAALALSAAIAALGLRERNQPWRDFAVMGLINNIVPFSLIFWGQTAIGAGLAAILNATTPVFGVLVAHALGGERATSLRLAGTITGFAGVAVLLGPQALGLSAAPLWAQLACLGAAVSYGFAAFYGKRFSRLAPIVTARGQLLASSVMLLPVILIIAPPWALPAPSLPAFGAMIALALVSTALAYVIFFAIMRRSGGANAVLVTLLVPVSALLLGAILLGERVTAPQLVGLAVILAGLVLIDGRLPRRLAG